MQDVISRVETWLKALFEGQAPHQQQLANDVKTLVDHAKATNAAPLTIATDADLADARHQIELLQGHVNSLLSDRNTLDDQLVKATNKITELTAELEQATAPHPTTGEGALLAPQPAIGVGTSPFQGFGTSKPSVGTESTSAIGEIKPASADADDVHR